MARLSPERVKAAEEIIGRYPVARSALIPLVHLAQEQDGWVTPEAMEHIGELIGCTPAEVYGTASFYEMFKFEPVGRYLVGICTNISCLLEGAYELMEHAEERLGVRHGGTTADGLFTLEEMECLAACTVAPCVQVNYRYFDKVTPTAFDAMVDDLRAGRLEGTVPPHGTLSRVRQTVPAARWAGSGAAAAPTAETRPGAALVRHGEKVGEAAARTAQSGGVDKAPSGGGAETGTARAPSERPEPGSGQ